MRRLLFLLGLLLSLPAGAAGLPEATAGAWFQGGCRQPTALLHLTARSAVVLPAAGPARLVRMVAVAEAGGWTIGTGGGAAAPRFMLRPDGAALLSAEPDAKLREDRLPGDTPISHWQRCPAAPPALALLHGEGLAALAMLEHLEAACGETAACLDALVRQADVSGDGALGVAEVARLARGLAWVVAVQDGTAAEALAEVGGIGGLAGLLTARLLVESLDFDGDGRLSAAELAQDRSGFGAARGTAAGAPMDIVWTAPGLAALRGLFNGLGGQK